VDYGSVHLRVEVPPGVAPDLPRYLRGIVVVRVELQLPANYRTPSAKMVAAAVVCHASDMILFVVLVGVTQGPHTVSGIVQPLQVQLAPDSNKKRALHFRLWPTLGRTRGSASTQSEGYIRREFCF
jgi:hypothetical protein